MLILFVSYLGCITLSVFWIKSLKKRNAVQDYWPLIACYMTIISITYGMAILIS